MAARDKIYGTTKQWKQFYNFIAEENPLYIVKYMYPQPDVYGPIFNGTKNANMWLKEHCKLDFVQQKLSDMYDD